MAIGLGTIGNYAPQFSGSFMTTLLWGVILIGGGVMLVVMIRNKMKYQYYGVILRRRQTNIEGLPQAMTQQGKAGYFKTKSGKTVFRIKWGFMPWMKMETSQLPDPQFMVGNMVVFLQVQKDNYAQAKIKINWDVTDEEGYAFKLEPIDDSLKYDAMLELNEIDRVLDQKKLTPTVVGIMVIGFIIVTGIVVFYFLGKA